VHLWQELLPAVEYLLCVTCATVQEKGEQDRLLSEHFQELEEEEGSSGDEGGEKEGPSTSGADSDQGHDSDSSQEQRQQKQRPRYKQQKALPQQQQQRGKGEQQQGPPRVKHREGPTMYAAKDAAAAQAFRRGELLSDTLQQPLVERVAAAAAAQQRAPSQGKRLGGSKEMTFVPSGSRGRGGGRRGGRGGGRGRGRGRGR
jgi:ribosome biogenesis protein ENP2